MNTRRAFNPAMQKILSGAKDELDTPYLLDCLKDYKSPKRKLNYLVSSGELVRIKQGIYIPGNQYAPLLYSKEVLANKIFGPSYLSLESALSYHRLIPEAVVHVTSVTFKRKKLYGTPIGNFFYEHLPKIAYPIGIEHIEIQKDKFAYIASKEKALADFLRIRRGRFYSLLSMQKTLFEDMRIDEEDLESFDLSIIERLIKVSPHSSLTYLLKALKEL